MDLITFNREIFILKWINLIREVAYEENTVLIDLEKNIPKTSNYIYDLFHFNVKRSNLVAEIISEKLVDELKN